MFPKSVVKLIDQHVPQLNPDIANGLACKHMRYVDEYVDSVLRAAAKGFPQGLEYVGRRICTPEEQFNEISRKKQNRHQFDLARTDFFLVEYSFRFGGEEIKTKKYFFLPFVNDGGIIHISGTRWVISPVLTDRVISIDEESIFVRLLKAKLTFSRKVNSFQINGGEIQSVHVVWGNIYNDSADDKSPKPKIRAHCTLGHYLFAKYGVLEAFRRFANCVPVIGEGDITEETYPPHEWVICQSRGIAPTGHGRGIYNPCMTRLAVRRSDYESHMVKNLISAFFYVADHFPTRVTPDNIAPSSGSVTRLWMVLLGHLIKGSAQTEGKLYNDMEDHIGSLDEYVDALVAHELKEVGHDISDIYQLFALLIRNFNDWILGVGDKIASMWDKKFSILYHTCYDVTSSIFKMAFKLTTAAKKKELTADRVTSIMNDHLKAGAAYRLSKEEHPETTTTYTAGSNKVLKTTILLLPQSNSSKGKSGKGSSNIMDAKKRMHASVAEVGAFLAIPKNDPSGRARCSPFVQLSETGLVLRNPDHVELLDRTQRLYFDRGAHH